MGIRSALSSVFDGEFKKAADLAFIPEEDIEAGKDVDKRIDEFNAKNPYRQIQNLSFYNHVEQSSPADAFADEFVSQGEKISSGVSGAFGKTIVETFNAFKWPILLAVVAFLIYLQVKKKL